MAFRSLYSDFDSLQIPLGFSYLDSGIEYKKDIYQLAPVVINFKPDVPLNYKVETEITENGMCSKITTDFKEGYVITTNVIGKNIIDDYYETIAENYVTDINGDGATSIEHIKIYPTVKDAQMTLCVFIKRAKSIISNFLDNLDLNSYSILKLLLKINEIIDTIDDNEPFIVKSLIYDIISNQIDINTGKIALSKYASKVRRIYYANKE